MRDHVGAAMGLAVALIAYNNLLNLWRPFQRFYVPINLCAAAGVIGLALGLLNLTVEELGLMGDTLSEAARFALAGLIITGPLYVALLSPRWAKLIADRRLEDSSRLEMLYRIFLRIPIGTVLLEEVAFRGVLFVLLVEYGTLTAALISSVAFALWHVVPTLAAARVNRILNGFGPWRAMTGGVLVTFGIGMILVWLRLQTGGLGAPFGIHAAVNSSAALAGFLALRKSGAGRI